MSTINKLSIKGIRSFAADRDGEQTITFTSPLTLIVGENGCGKTTIIESLKYALTGETPPGSGSGKTFVNDPKISSTSSVMGQVKLKVTDTLGNQKTCIRSMKVETKKNGDSKFSTLDSTITYEDLAGGKNEQLGKKVEETNIEMCAAMGVSKAVLNNVIFCHQEESNWPLDEGKKLKEKFDAIFGTTEYNKAITKFIGYVKRYEADLKLAKKDCEMKEEFKKEEEKKSMTLENHKQKKVGLMEEVKKRADLLSELDAKLEESNKKMYDFQKVRSAKLALQEKVKAKDEDIERLKKRIKTLLTEDESSISNQLQEFSKILEKKKVEKENLVKEHKSLIDKENENLTTIGKCKTQIELLSDKIGSMQEQMDRRVSEMKKIATKMDLNLTVNIETQSIDQSELDDAITQIKSGMSNKEKELSNLKDEDMKSDQDMQKKIDAVRVERTEIQTKTNSIVERIRETENKKISLNSQIASIERSLPDLQKLENDIKRDQEALEKLKNENDLDELEDQRAVLEVEKESYESQIAKLDVELEKAEEFQRVRTEIDQKEKDIAKDKADYDRTKNKQTSSLRNIFPSNPPTEKFKEKVQELQTRLESDCRRMNEDINSKNSSLNRCKTELEHYKKQLDIKRKDLLQIERNIEELCGDREYIDVLNETKEKVEKFTQELAYLKSSKDSFNHYISDIDEQPCCPLCHKDLAPNEKEDLHEEIQDKIRQLPRKLSETQRKWKKESAEFDKLNTARSSYDAIAKLKKDIESFETQIKKSKTLESTLSGEIEDIETSLAEPKSKCSIISTSFLFDMSKLDDMHRRIQQKTQEIESLKREMPADIPEKSVQVLRDDKRKIVVEAKAKYEQMNQIGKRISEFQKKIHALQEKLNSMITRKASQQEQIQGLERMRQEVVDYESNKSDLQSKVAQNNLNLKPIEEKLTQLQHEKEAQKQSRSKKILKMQSTIDELKLNYNEIDRLSKSIRDFESMKLDEKMEKYRLKIDECEKLYKTLQEKRRKVSETIQQFQELLVDQEGKRRNLEDNLEVCRLEREKKEASDKLIEISAEYGNFDYNKIIAEQGNLQDQRDKASSDRSCLHGQIQSIEKQIKDSEEELSADRYKNAKRYYLKECYKVGILEASISDFKAYRAVLEKAVIKFHQDKMNQINQSIREYWNSIYRGNDIDYIMIKTSEDDDGKTINKEEKKRSYSYRVVQAKNGGAEIDMRGRCSAGQKVLASLIIRMALADTFSLNCGILALDEPTTNLDHNNIMSLCTALSQIVEEREKMNSRFMLIVITHDMEFIKTLDRAENYYHVSRDNYGNSKIDRVDNIA